MLYELICLDEAFDWSFPPAFQMLTSLTFLTTIHVWSKGSI